MLPGDSAIKLALAFARIAESDLKVSKLAYKNGFYPQAVFSLQQSVEKATKAVGILMGLVNPDKDDLVGEVGHSTIKAILVRYPERIVRIRANLETLEKNPHLGPTLNKWNELVPGIPLPHPTETKMKLIRKEEAKKQIALVELLNSRDLWKVTLEADPKNSRMAVVFKLLDDAESQWRATDWLQEVFEEKFASLMEDAATVRYILGVNMKAFPEVAPLSFLTTWHEKETRYPPVDPGDYWDPTRYTKDSGLVKLLPRVYRHATRLCDGALVGAKAALVI